jgi:DNA-binding SARP family transcriptional activator/streptogramin lyase
MEFRLLGPLEVWESGRPIPLPGPGVRSLLAFLLLNANDVVPRDQLIGELWDDPPPTANKIVHAYVSQLRKIRGPELLLTRTPGYVLQVTPDQLDTLRFEQLVAEARRADTRAKAAKLKEALALWRGPALADVGAPFVERERLRLDELRLTALEERVEADLRLGRHAELVPELEQLVREHSFREGLTAQLMLALYRSARQAEALQVYQDARRKLVEELGLEPGVELQQLERAILAHDPALDAPGEAAAAPVPSGTVTFLFTDIEGSTQLVRKLRDGYAEVLAEHQRILRDAFRRHGGEEIDTQGDSFFVAFPRARDSVLAALAAQRAVAAQAWPEGVDVRVRMGIHTGGAAVAGDRYLGLAVHRASRICGVAHGGQVLVSQTTQTLLEDEEDELDGATLRDLGPQRLKDLNRPVRLYQLVAPDLPTEFPALRTDDAAGGAAGPFTGREQELAAAAEVAVGVQAYGPLWRRLLRTRVLVPTGIVVAGAVVAAVALLPSSKPLTAGPNSVAAIDPKTNKVVTVVSVGNTPGSIATGLGEVWVVNANEQTVSRVDPATRTATRIGSLVNPTSVAVGAGSVWVATVDHRLSRIDPSTRGVAATRTLPQRSNPLLVLPGPSHVAAGPDGVWVTSPGILSRIRPGPEEIKLSSCCGVIAVGRSSIWGASPSGIVHVDPVSASATPIRLSFIPSALAVGAGGVWATDTGGDAVWRIDPATDRVRDSVHVSHPIAVATGPNVVWVATTDGTVARIDPNSSPPVVADTITVGGTPAGLASGEGLLWISVD